MQLLQPASPWFLGPKLEAVTARFSIFIDEQPQDFDVRRFKATEEAGSLYRAHVDCVTTDLDLELSSVVGRPALLEFSRGSSAGRTLPGIVTACEYQRNDGSQLHFRVVVEPVLVLLRYSQHRRVFTDTSVPAVLSELAFEVLGPRGRHFADYLIGSYPSVDYLVQYDETDLDFFLRIAAEAGICLFFEVEDDKVETLVFWDRVLYPAVGDPFAVTPRASIAPAPYPFMTESPELASHESIQFFARRTALQPARVQIRGWDWKAPEPLMVTSSEELQPPTCGGVFELASPRLTEEPQMLRDDTEVWVDLETERRNAQAAMHTLRSNIHDISPGSSFELVEHPHADHDGIYVAVSVAHEADFPSVEIGAPDDATSSYSNQVTCLPKGFFLQGPKPPKPVAKGLHTGIVVGPPGEEIHTDRHGRVLVRLPWSDEGETTVWLRVVQAWAGNGFGSLFIPRIGMEVVVGFLEGDPDRPVVQGCLYNGGAAAPSCLPEHRARSVLRTRSTPADPDRPPGFNELRFDDATGSEEVFLRAQRNLRESVRANHNTKVGANQSVTVGKDASRSVGENDTLEIGKDRVMTVRGNEAHVIEGSSSLHVQGLQGQDDKVGMFTLVNGEYFLQTHGPITIESRRNSEFSRIVLRPDGVTIQAKTILLESIEGTSTTDTELEISPRGIAGRGQEEVALSAPGGAVHISAHSTEVVGGAEEARSALRLDDHFQASSPRSLRAEAPFIHVQGEERVEVHGRATSVTADEVARIQANEVGLVGETVTSKATGDNVIRGKMVRIN